MTRQIICMKCAERKPGDYPGEWWVRVSGKARGFKNGDFVCDLCNAIIPKGTDCVAQSFGLDRHPYYIWEQEYLDHAPGVVDGTVRHGLLSDLADMSEENFNKLLKSVK